MPDGVDLRALSISSGIVIAFLACARAAARPLSVLLCALMKLTGLLQTMASLRKVPYIIAHVSLIVASVEDSTF